MMRAPLVAAMVLVAWLPMVDAVPSSPIPPTPTSVEVPDAPGWVAILLVPENDQPIYVQADFTVDSLYALFAFDYLAQYPDREPQLAGGVYATKDRWQVRVVSDGEEILEQEVPTRNPGGPYEYSLGGGAPAIPYVFLFYAAGDIKRFDITVHSGRIERLEMGPEVWALWTTQIPDGDTRAYLGVSFGADINSERAQTSFTTPRPLIGEFFGGQAYDPATLTGPLGTQTCKCNLLPSNSAAGEYTYDMHRSRADSIMFWAFAPILPYLDT